MEKITNCKNCGAPINWRRGICEYCGTHYKEHDPFEPPRIVLDSRPAQVYQAKVMIPWEAEKYMGPDEMARETTRILAEKLTAALYDNMDIRYDRDIETMTKTATARIRILPKDFRF